MRSTTNIGFKAASRVRGSGRQLPSTVVADIIVVVSAILLLLTLLKMAKTSDENATLNL